MTATGRYASSDSSLGRSTGNAAARGTMLILIAVLIGTGLLWKGRVGSDATIVVADTAADATADGTEAGTEAGAEEGTEEGTADGTEAVAGTDDGASGETPTSLPSDTPATPTTRPIGEIKVAVANGVGENGLAGDRSEVLGTAGYVVTAVDAKETTEPSAVYYIDSYGHEASGVATELGGSDEILRAMPVEAGTLVKDATKVEGFHVIVVLGTDRLLG